LLGARLFYVSSISYINNNNEFFVLDRDNGQPLANASIQVWEQKYDYQKYKYVKEKGKLYKTIVMVISKWKKYRRKINVMAAIPIYWI
jgi:hypothetical protein